MATTDQPRLGLLGRPIEHDRVMDDDVCRLYNRRERDGIAFSDLIRLDRMRLHSERVGGISLDRVKGIFGFDELPKDAPEGNRRCLLCHPTEGRHFIPRYWGIVDANGFLLEKDGEPIRLGNFTFRIGRESSLLILPGCGLPNREGDHLYLLRRIVGKLSEGADSENQRERYPSGELRTFVFNNTRWLLRRPEKKPYPCHTYSGALAFREEFQRRMEEDEQLEKEAIRRTQTAADIAKAARLAAEAEARQRTRAAHANEVLEDLFGERVYE